MKQRPEESAAAAVRAEEVEEKEQQLSEFGLFCCTLLKS
jgi:hypothetical protein